MVGAINPTLENLMRHHMIIEVTCRRCQHAALVQPADLAEKLDARTDFRRAPYLCGCGSRAVQVIAFPRDWK